MTCDRCGHEHGTAATDNLYDSWADECIAHLRVDLAQSRKVLDKKGKED